ncbi:hypothetical protein ACJRO7_009155 [Eucalyptus globulus]|uniref:Uncharacterized protein n=1 Tax=Eucalyptus globulus TaxID=34317 RepID=A0ABD3IUR0_EUCGL
MAELSQVSRTGRGARLQRQLRLELAGRRKVAAGVVAASTLGAHQQEGDDGAVTVVQARQGVKMRRWMVSRMELGELLWHRYSGGGLRTAARGGSVVVRTSSCWSLR